MATKPLAGRGQQLSKKDIAEINEQQKKKELQMEINQAVQKFADETIYEKGLPDNFSELVRQSMCHFSDSVFRMPYPAYRSIAVITDNKYSYQQMNMIMQLIMTASAEQMNMGLDEWIVFRDAVQIIAGEYSVALEDNRERITAEIMGQLAPAGEA